MYRSGGYSHYAISMKSVLPEVTRMIYVTVMRRNTHMTNEIARPEYYSLILDRYNIKAELTATDRVGFHRYTYPEGKPASILIDLREGNGSNAYDSYIRKVDDYTVEGYRYVRGWSPSRKVYFVLKSDKKIEQFTAYDDNTPQTLGPTESGIGEECPHFRQREGSEDKSRPFFRQL